MAQKTSSKLLKISIKTINRASVSKSRVQRFQVVLEDENGAQYGLNAARAGKSCPYELSLDLAAMTLALKFTPDRRDSISRLAAMAGEYAFDVKIRELALCHSTEVTIRWGFGQSKHIAAFLKKPEVAVMLPSQRVIDALERSAGQTVWGGVSKRRRFAAVHHIHYSAVRRAA